MAQMQEMSGNPRGIAAGLLLPSGIGGRANPAAVIASSSLARGTGGKNCRS